MDEEATFRLEREYSHSEDPTRYTYVFKAEPPSQEAEVYVMTLKATVDALHADNRLTADKTYTRGEIMDFSKKYGIPEEDR